MFLRQTLLCVTVATGIVVSNSAFACADDEGAQQTTRKSTRNDKQPRHASTTTPDGDSHVVKIASAANVLEGEISLGVPGIKCSSCKEKLETAIQKLPEVKSVSADVKNKSITIALNQRLPKERLVQALEDAGFIPQ